MKRQEIEMLGDTIPLTDTSSGHYIIDISENQQENQEDFNCYYANSVQEVLLNSDLTQDDVKKLHVQFGHCRLGKFRELLKLAGLDTVTNLKYAATVCNSCENCLTHQRNPNRPKVCLPRATSFNEVVSVDLHSLGSGYYYLHMIDEFSKYSCAAIMKSKYPTEFIDNFSKHWITHFGCPNRNGGEFVSDETTEWAQQFNIDLQTTPGYSPFSNGSVERHNPVLTNMLDKLQDNFHLSS